MAIDPEELEEIPPQGHVRVVYTGPVAPHWEIHRVFGDQRAIDEFRHGRWRACSCCRSTTRSSGATASGSPATRSASTSSSNGTSATSRSNPALPSDVASGLETTRAITVNTKTITMSVSAAPQARSIAAANGDCALNQITCDSVVFVPWNGFGSTTVGDPDREEQRRGLAGGAGDGEHGAADDAGQRGRKHDRHTVRQRRAPSASLAWRRSSGTSFSISSHERMTIGSISAPSASSPRSPSSRGADRRSPRSWRRTVP